MTETIPVESAMDSADELIQIETSYGVFWTRENDFVNDQLKNFGGHQRSELGMIRSLSRKGDVLLDVGAHIGTFCIPLAQHVGESGRIFAFEPIPDSHRILEKNIAENNLAGRATAINALISDDASDYKVHISHDHTSAAYFVPVEDTKDQQEPPANTGEARDSGATAIHLDSWGLKGEAPLERLDVIKVDTEGMELRVLRSAAGLIERFRPVIMAEMSGAHLARSGDSVKEVGKFLRKRGYRFYRNLGPRHAQNEEFELAKLWNPVHVSELYDLVAVHAESDRHPSKARSALPAFLRWIWTRSISLLGAVKRRLFG